MGVTETGTRAREPDEHGYATTSDGLRLYWERFGDGGPTIVLLPPTPDQPLAAVEGAGALPRAPPPGDRLRRARQRVLGRPGSVGDVADALVERRTAWRSWTPHRRSPRCSAASAATGSGLRSRSRRRIPSACSGSSRSHPASRCWRPPRRGGRRRPGPGTSGPGPAGLGEGEPALHPRRPPRVPRVLLRRDVPGAALDQAGRGRRGVRARRVADASGHGRRRAGRQHPRGGRGRLPARALPGARRAGRRGQVPAARARAGPGRAHRRRSGHARRRRPHPHGAPAGAREPADPRLRRPGRAADAAPERLGALVRAAAAGVAAVLADRARPCVARRGDRARAAASGARAGGPLARPAAADDAAGRLRGDGPSRERRARAGGAARRRRGGRARAARVPDAAPARRDLLRELHGLPRSRAGRGVRRLDRRRGVGGRLLPARAPGAQDGAVRVDDRLRRRAADGRGRRARGVPGRRHQRPDGRARRPQPARARPLDLHRRSRRRRRRPARARPAGDPRVDRGALPLHRLRHRPRPRRGRRPRRAPRRAGLRARREDLHRRRRRLRRRHPPARARRSPPSRRPSGASPSCA